MSRPIDFNLTKNEFLDQPKNMGDDEILALWAQRNNVPLIAVDNTHCLIESQKYDIKIALCYIHRLDDHRFKVLNTYSNWHLVTP